MQSTMNLKPQKIIIEIISPMNQAFENKLRGTYCQLTDGDHIRFLEIYACEYHIDKIERLRQLGNLEDSVIFSYLKHLKTEVPGGTRYLFKLMTYYGLSGIKDLWNFNESITQYEEFSFVSLNELLSFVEERWKITAQDFKPKNETSIPE